VPTFGPISRAELVRNLRKAGFDGPYPGGKHQHMVKGDLTLTMGQQAESKPLNCGEIPQRLHAP
jgi:hypothetical protein